MHIVHVQNTMQMIAEFSVGPVAMLVVGFLYGIRRERSRRTRMIFVIGLVGVVVMGFCVYKLEQDNDNRLHKAGYVVIHDR